MDDFDDQLFERIYGEVVAERQAGGAFAGAGSEQFIVARECAHRYCKAVDKQDFEGLEHEAPCVKCGGVKAHKVNCEDEIAFS